MWFQFDASEFWPVYPPPRTPTLVVIGRPLAPSIAFALRFRFIAVIPPAPKLLFERKRKRINPVHKLLSGVMLIRCDCPPTVNTEDIEPRARVDGGKSKKCLSIPIQTVGKRRNETDRISRSPEVTPPTLAKRLTQFCMNASVLHEFLFAKGVRFNVSVHQFPRAIRKLTTPRATCCGVGKSQ